MKFMQALVGSDSSSDSEKVETYLRQHPEFFSEHLELLEGLRIPHPSGEAVSLVAKQIELLRERNFKLQSQLGEILQIARDNDALARRLHQLTLAMLDATSVDDALAGLRWSLKEGFQADFVAVRLLEPLVDSPINDLLVNEPGPADYIAALAGLEGPEFSQPSPEKAAMLFGGNGADVASQAVVPLSRAGLRGVFAIGSCDPNRFEAGMGHLFLSQMGEIVAARLVSLLSNHS